MLLIGQTRNAQPQVFHAAESTFECIQSGRKFNHTRRLLAIEIAGFCWERLPASTVTGTQRRYGSLLRARSVCNAVISFVGTPPRAQAGWAGSGEVFVDMPALPLRC
jgi:hypothetical protein